MTKKNRLISIAISVMLTFAVLCSAGVTLAMNVSSNRTSGSITTANLSLSATAKNVAVYTAVAATEADEDTFEDNDGNLYKYRQCTEKNSDGAILFGNRGGVKFVDKSVSIENIMPGDKVEFDIEVSSASSISFDYRAELYVDSTKGQTLLNQLNFSAGGLGILRKDVSDEPASSDELSQAVLTDYTKWMKVSASKTKIETVHVSLDLPITATKGQGETLQISYVVRGVQSTEQNKVASLIAPGGETLYFDKLSEAVEYAEANGVRNINIIDSTVLEEGEVNIRRALNFIGVADGDGKYPTLNGARIVVANGAAASFKNVNFDGASYIDVSGAMGLTLENCKAEVTPVKYYDNAIHDFAKDPAFIVSGTSLTPVKLNLSNNRIASERGAAISLSSPLSNGSVINGNVFGTEKLHYDGAAVMAFNGAYNLDSASERPVITVSDNVIYGDRAFSLGSSAGETPYMVISKSNVAHGIENNEFVVGAKYDGKSYAAFTDSGSKIGESAITCANISPEDFAFGGVDVVLDGRNLIVSGKIAVSDNITVEELYTRYTVGNVLKDRAVILYRDGAPYAYLNSENRVEPID